MALVGQTGSSLDGKPTLHDSCVAVTLATSQGKSIVAGGNGARAFLIHHG